MKRKDEFLGSLQDCKGKTVAIFTYEPPNGIGGFILLGRWGYAFETEEDVDEFIEMLEKLKERIIKQ